MAAEKKDVPLLTMTTMIDVFAIKGEIIIKETMSHENWLSKKKTAGWIYRSFQINTSSLIPNMTVEEYVAMTKNAKSK